jgi:site-specific DNA-methyltransferase (adenine-specific)
MNNFTEWIFHFTKDKNKIKFNMDAVRSPYKESSLKRVKSKMNDYEVLEDGTKVLKQQTIKSLNPKGKTPDGLLKFPNNSNSRGNKHPAPFSVDLPKWFIKALTDEGDVVLDPFMGSGTTAVASIELKRKWVGFELSPIYIDMINIRVDDNQPDEFFG